MFSKQLASCVIIAFLVQCSQGSEEQTGYPNPKIYIALCLTGFSLRKPVIIIRLKGAVIEILYGMAQLKKSG